MIRAYASASSSVASCLTITAVAPSSIRRVVTAVRGRALCCRFASIGRRRGEREEQPARDRDEPEQCADGMERPADALVVRQHTEVAEEKRPIVFAAANERQLLRPRIADVDRDVPQILRDPPERHCRRMPVAAAGEVHEEDGRDDELEKRAARELDNLAKWREDEVPCLVDREIDRVEKAPRLGMPHERNPVE